MNEILVQRVAELFAHHAKNSALFLENDGIELFIQDKPKQEYISKFLSQDMDKWNVSVTEPTKLGDYTHSFFFGTFEKQTGEKGDYRTWKAMKIKGRAGYHDVDYSEGHVSKIADVVEQMHKHFC